jgi:hypothetical protein
MLKKLNYMVIIGPYPAEISFFPEHLIIPFITLAVFLVLLYVLARIKLANRLDMTEVSPADMIALIGVLVTIASALFIPFSQLPIIDYSVVANPSSTGQQGGSQTIEVTIHIYGIIAAKNVSISMSANNAEFRVPTSTPFLADHLTFDGSQIGNALVGIDVLPAGSHTIIKIPVVSQSSGNQPEPELLTYVRTDTSVGYNQTTYLFIFYGILSLVYAGLTLALVKMKMSPLLEPKNGSEKIRLLPFVKIGVPISAGIVVANFIFLYLL